MVVVEIMVDRKDDSHGWDYLNCQKDYCHYKTHFLPSSPLGVRAVGWTCIGLLYRSVAPVLHLIHCIFVPKYKQYRTDLQLSLTTPMAMFPELIIYIIFLSDFCMTFLLAFVALSVQGLPHPSDNSHSHNGSISKIVVLPHIKATKEIP